MGQSQMCTPEPCVPRSSPGLVQVDLSKIKVKAAPEDEGRNPPPAIDKEHDLKQGPTLLDPACGNVCDDGPIWRELSESFIQMEVSTWQRRVDDARAAQHGESNSEVVSPVPEAVEVVEKERLRAFLKTHGFRAVSSRRLMAPRASCPLHAAVIQGDAEMVRLLLKSGANAAQRNAFGQTPERLARHRRRHDLQDGVLAAFADAHGAGPPCKA